MVDVLKQLGEMPTIIYLVLKYDKIACISKLYRFKFIVFGVPSLYVGL